MNAADSRTPDGGRRRKDRSAIPQIEATSPEKRAMLIALREYMRGNDTDTQELRLFAALQYGPITTNEARRYLDVYHPPGRVMSLRRRGRPIQTHRVRQRTEAGPLHTVGLYVLAPLTPNKAIPS